MYGCVPWVCTFGMDVSFGYVPLIWPVHVWMCPLDTYLWWTHRGVDVFLGYIPLVWPVHVWTCPFGMYLWCGWSMRGCVSWVRMYLWYGWSMYGCVLWVCTFGMACPHMDVSLWYVPLVWPVHAWMCFLGTYVPLVWLVHVWMCPFGYMYLWYGRSTHGRVPWVRTFGMA